MKAQYNLQSVPDGVAKNNEENQKDESVIKWSGSMPVPSIGDEVEVSINRLGAGVVVNYFIEHGWLGVCVKLSNAPEWHLKQHPRGSLHHKHALVFGSEIKLVKSREQAEQEKREMKNQRARNRRRAMKAAMDSVGVRHVRGSMGGSYWE